MNPAYLRHKCIRTVHLFCVIAIGMLLVGCGGGSGLFGSTSSSSVDGGSQTPGDDGIAPAGTDDDSVLVVDDVVVDDNGIPDDPEIDGTPGIAGLGPIGDAGENQVVAALALVTLDGSNSESESGSLNYEWSQFSGPAVSINGANSETSTFTAPSAVGNPVELAFELIVTEDGFSASDTVIVTVLPAEIGPVDSSACTGNAECDDSIYCNGSEQCVG